MKAMSEELNKTLSLVLNQCNDVIPDSVLKLKLESLKFRSEYHKDEPKGFHHHCVAPFIFYCMGALENLYRSGEVSEEVKKELGSQLISLSIHP